MTFVIQFNKSQTWTTCTILRVQNSFERSERAELFIHHTYSMWRYEERKYIFFLLVKLMSLCSNILLRPSVRPFVSLSVGAQWIKDIMSSRWKDICRTHIIIIQRTEKWFCTNAIVNSDVGTIRMLDARLQFHCNIMHKSDPTCACICNVDHVR